MENDLAQYLIQQSKLYFGLSTREVRRLAYESSVKNNIEVRENWIQSQMASSDSITAFLKRHAALSLQQVSVEQQVLTKTMFMFFSLLEEVLGHYKFKAQDMYIVDEMGITTVQKPDRIIATKGVK